MSAINTWLKAMFETMHILDKDSWKQYNRIRAVEAKVDELTQYKPTLEWFKKFKEEKEREQAELAKHR